MGINRSFWAYFVFFTAAWVAWETCRAESEMSVQKLISILRELPTGAKLVEKAKPELLETIRWGSVSRSDAIITRTYDPETRVERRDRQVIVYLRKSGNVPEMLLDLAHELTHATGKPLWDPYDVDLTAGKYIRETLEGDSGEVDAVVSECQVAIELQERFSTKLGRCARYLDETSHVAQISREKVRIDFYRVGSMKSALVRELGSEASKFPLLSDEKPELFSSTGLSPYPIALFREFRALNQTACENTKRRLNTQKTEGRVLASTRFSRAGASRESGPIPEEALFLKKRCRR